MPKLIPNSCLNSQTCQKDMLVSGLCYISCFMKYFQKLRYGYKFCKYPQTEKLNVSGKMQPGLDFAI